MSTSTAFMQEWPVLSHIFVMLANPKLIKVEKFIYTILVSPPDTVGFGNYERLTVR